MGALLQEEFAMFVENENVEVTAREYDRDLAAARNSIIINGNKAMMLSIIRIF